ncbi:phytanoyl-CoA dioxygenase family protein [Vibrio sp. S9_S30]|uniref:phytanoyl-CoA dioxygenase family protein n=1 Tax=Vibrio sp. S9_S30 TaxID=2720226 RepID=UPI001681B3B8|nr:phytanoyl-CoA dioxygenase family protein [Vibrio sp. S9_S30]MBD1556105.1 phytanoyl-CoA dioxygenase family protein [Vibrio sp. S9_S30]
MLSQQQILQYHEQGYLVLDQMIPLETLNELKQRAAKIVEKWKPDRTTTSIFTTNDNDRTGDNYFLDSAEKIRCFFEEEAFDKSGQLIEQKALCINKIGHALHELDPIFREFSHLPVLGDIANDIGIGEPQIRQSMYIFKQPKIGGVVNWHQDATFFFTTPQSVTTYWFAIEDATLENGCLWVEPKGHTGPLRERFNRDGDSVSMVKLDNTPWPTEQSGVPVEVKAGSLIIFQGLLPHYSAPNRSAKSRQAFTLHVTDGHAHYAKENWLQTILLPLRGFD